VNDLGLLGDVTTHKRQCHPLTYIPVANQILLIVCKKRNRKRKKRNRILGSQCPSRNEEFGRDQGILKFLAPRGHSFHRT
jgi:hypothetical protein